MILQFFRKKKNLKRIMWVLAILIIPAFVIWGAGGSGKKRTNGPGYAGKLFNRKVSFEEYIDMWNVTKDYVVKNLGSNIPPEFIDGLTWNRILLLEAAERENIVVQDEELAAKIASFPVFQRNGNFDKKLYKSMFGGATKAFEEKLRDDILISKLREKIISNISVSAEDVDASYKKKFEKIKASYISIPFTDFEKDVQYKESDLIKFYENNKEDFRNPEEANVTYIEILFSHFDKDVSISEKEIATYFEEHLGDFKDPDSEEMPVLNDDAEKEISEKLAAERKRSLAEELAYKVLDTALDRKDIDETALLFSSESKETGFFNQQQEIPDIGWSYEFTKIGFELSPGTISKTLIRTDKGFYIVQLKEKKPSYIPEFEKTKDSVISSFIRNGSISIAQQKANDIYEMINDKLKDGSIFVDSAEEAGLERTQTDLITRDGYIPTLGPAKEFVEATLNLEKETITKPIKMLDSWVISKLDEYQEIDQDKFLEEKEIFKENLLSTKKQEAFDEWFNKVRKEADFVSYTAQ